MRHVRRRAFITFIGRAAAWPLAAALLAAGISATGPASAQTYPSRPITLVVPYPPGGATDAIARIIQDSMSQSLGQQIVIENIGGAGGMIAAGRAARAAPDGYTVLLHQVALAAGMTLYPNLAFDAEKDFVPIGLINTAASTLSARPTLPPNDIAELVRWMKTPGQNVKIAHPGVGSFGHLAGVLVAEEVGASVTHVPYRGAGPALNDLMAGHIDLMFDQATNSLPQVRGGNVRAYAVTSRSRLASAPDIPTVDEAGLPGLYIAYWHGIWAPKNTPGEVVARLNASVVAALADPSVQQRFLELGQETPPPERQTPSALKSHQTAEIEKWWPIVKAANIKAE